MEFFVVEWLGLFIRRLGGSSGAAFKSPVEICPTLDFGLSLVSLLPVRVHHKQKIHSGE